VENSIKYIQENAKIFQYAILYLKHHAFKMFRSAMSHFQVEKQKSIMNETGIKLGIPKPVFYTIFLWFLYDD